MIGVVSLSIHPAEASPPGGGFLSSLFVPRINVPEFPGEKTETILAPLVKEHHEHAWVEKPHFEVQKTESYGKQQQQILHNHVTHQKVVHEDHQHKHVLNEHTQHNVHTHNIHNLVQHIHEVSSETELSAPQKNIQNWNVLLMPTFNSPAHKGRTTHP